MSEELILSIGAVGALVSALGCVPYLLDTMRGVVRPRIATWATWSLVTGITTIVALSEQAYASALLTGGVTCLELAILGAALRKGDFDYSWVDAVSQAISVVGIIAWLTTHNPVWGIAFTILADFFGAVPTFYHAWVSPHEESWTPFMLGGLGAAISFATVGGLGFVAAGYPLYMVFVEFSMGAAIYYRQRYTFSPKAVWVHSQYRYIAPQTVEYRRAD